MQTDRRGSGRVEVLEREDLEREQRREAGEYDDPPYTRYTRVGHYLLVGSAPGGVTPKTYDDLGVGLIIDLQDVSVHDLRTRIVPDVGKMYVRLPLRDGQEIDTLDPVVRAGIMIARELVFTGTRVLIHCTQGLVRSVQFAGYVMGGEHMCGQIGAMRCTEDTFTSKIIAATAERWGR